MPYVHSMVRESRQEGWRQEGRDEGQLEGRRQMLAEVLASRFGALPEPVRLQLQAASHEQLSRWASRALVAPTLAELTGA
ncbi:transposase [Pseudoduganella sp. DS3]|uniref:Transposase n=1 Tax=Pseudoduganella guangdongensis TaxID=2692179 RepID=A0A6N9HM57_9BURK|nr:transposase [Pseudoduganella guangdongensis]MYN03972.1 transposase [Pseudoduganella guangdongensis]